MKTKAKTKSATVLKPRMGESNKAFADRVWQHRTKWINHFPGWFRPAVVEAHRLGFVSGRLEGSDRDFSYICLQVLQFDPRFRFLLNHCGGECRVFICEPYLPKDEIEIAANALGEILGCTWTIVPGGNTWGPGTTRVEFRRFLKTEHATDVPEAKIPRRTKHRERRPNGRLSQGKSVDDYVTQIKNWVLENVE